MLLAPSLILDRPTSPLCATLRIACKNPYSISVDDKEIVTKASLVAPKAGRKRIVALDSDMALFYLPLDAPENAGLKEMLGTEPIIELPFRMFEPFVELIQQAMYSDIKPEQMKELARDVVAAITGKPFAPARELDPRISLAYKVLDEMPLNEVSLAAVAEKVHLSTSRVRELFKAETGFTITDYARWRSVWRMCLEWKAGKQFTQLALDAGFHDLAHADKVFIDIFGMNPSQAFDPKFVRLTSCCDV